MSATIQAEGVSAGHGDKELFSGLDLVVAPGDVVGLVGPNGAGKSTMLRILAGLRAPDAGRVSLSPPTRSAASSPRSRTGGTRRSASSWAGGPG